MPMNFTQLPGLKPIPPTRDGMGSNWQELAKQYNVTIPQGFTPPTGWQDMAGQAQNPMRTEGYAQANPLAGMTSAPNGGAANYVFPGSAQGVFNQLGLVGPNMDAGLQKFAQWWNDIPQGDRAEIATWAPQFQQRYLEAMRTALNSQHENQAVWYGGKWMSAYEAAQAIRDEARQFNQGIANANAQARQNDMNALYNKSPFRSVGLL